MGPEEEDHLIVQITLKRRFLFQLPTTFLPTLCLIVIAEISLHFDGTKYEPTQHMVSLTAMLVMYTLYQKVAGDLPQTSYMKLIDIWLIYCLMVPFWVFITVSMTQLAKIKREKAAKMKVNAFDLKPF